MDLLDKNISTLIKKYRKQAGLSQERLALESNLDRTFISFLERGLRTPTLHTIFKICLALEVKPSVFVLEVEQSIENNSSKDTN